MIKKSKNYKNRLLIIAIGFPVMVFLMFQFAIRETINIRKEYAMQVKIMDSLIEAPGKLNEIESQLIAIDNEIGVNNKDQDLIQKELLKTISKLCMDFKLVLRNFNEPQVYIEGEYRINTINISVDGPFNSLIKLLSVVEKMHFGEIVSTHFASYTNLKTRQKKLVMELQFMYLEKI